MKFLAPFSAYLFVVLFSASLAFAERDRPPSSPPPGCEPCTEKIQGSGCVPSGKQYCASSCYDPKEWNCLVCNGNANLNKGPAPTCCGTSACPSSASCCVDKCYDPRRQVCCANGSESSVCNQGYYGVSCCGSTCNYNNNAETLCCSDAPDGTPYLASGGRSCCHGVGVDLTRERCCVDGAGQGSTVPLGQSCPSVTPLPSPAM